MNKSISPAILKEVAQKLENQDTDKSISGFKKLHFSINKEDVNKVMFTISPEELNPHFSGDPVEFTEVYVGE